MLLDLIPVAAAQNIGGTDLTQLSLGDVVYLFAALAILGAGALSIVFIFFGGFSFILSGGDEGKVKQAIHTIRYAIIGLVIALLSLFFVPMIGKLFNVDFDFLDTGKLSEKINTLFSQFKSEDTTTSKPVPTAKPNTPTPDVSVSDLIQ
jgi:hypothetical protein